MEFKFLKLVKSIVLRCLRANKTVGCSEYSIGFVRLIQENSSKNTIINILVENHTFDISNLKSQFTTVNSKSRQKKSWPWKHKKVDLNCSNCYETQYITDSNTESESEDSDDITTTDISTDSNTRPGYTHRIHQENDNLKEVNKVKNNIYEKCK